MTPRAWLAALRRRTWRYPTIFCANDAVLPQTLAFLESIAQNAPALDLLCIPFDHHMAQIRALQRSYRFDVAAVDIGADLAALSTRLYGDVRRRLVKLCAFDLLPGAFLFLDTDVLVLQDLRPLFGLLRDEALLFADESRGQCYVDRADRRLQGSREFNSGVFLAAGGRLSSARIAAVVMQELALYRAAGFLQNDDQAMLNFAIDMLGLPVRDFAEAGSVYATDAWFLKESIVCGAGGVTAAGKPVPLLHFAGHSHRGLEHAPRFAGLYAAYLAQARRRTAAA